MVIENEWALSVGQNLNTIWTVFGLLLILTIFIIVFRIEKKISDSDEHSN